MDFTKKTILGRTGLSVSRLGLAGGYGVPAAAVERAFHEYGINYFYWSTPRKSGMGDGLKNLVSSNRKDIVIVLQTYDHLGLTVSRSVHKGISALGTDYADVLLLGCHYSYPPARIIRQSLALREKGMVRFIGMSGHNRKLFGEIARRSDCPIDIFMVRYNAAHRGAEEEVFPYLVGENRPGLTTYTATRWGKLLNPKKMPPGQRPLTPSDCYRFVLTDPHVDLCMMGPKNEAQMVEGLAALARGPLPADEMDRIRKIGDYVHG
ncbi:MAG: aldo/keto reductase [Deltaproteobacteria bacterium]|nr:aldo/keto reductase [Candidatus Zymogenaceae bacterium]